MNFTRNNFSNFNNRNSNRYTSGYNKNNRCNKTTSLGGSKMFKPKKRMDVNNIEMFPALSDKQTATEPCENKTSFLDKTKKCDIKDEQKDDSLDEMNNLPMGWVRLSETNPSSPTKQEIEWQETKDEFERKKKLVKGIWSSLRHIQKQRDELNEVLGSNSPYYDTYNILGPPGESDDEYEDDEYYSTSENSEDEYE